MEGPWCKTFLGISRISPFFVSFGAQIHRKFAIFVHRRGGVRPWDNCTCEGAFDLGSSEGHPRKGGPRSVPEFHLNVMIITRVLPEIL